MSKEALSILVVDDEEIIRRTLGEYLEDCGHDVTHAEDGRRGLELALERRFDVALVDIRMPRMDGLTLMERAQGSCPDTAFVAITGHADLEVAIEALRSDAADFLVKPVKLEQLDLVLERALRLRDLRREGDRLRATIGSIQRASRARECSWEFLGQGPAARAVRELIEEAAAGCCDTVLITGETGVGKEVVARAIHLALCGESAPFIPVNCPAIPRELVESELFGHMRGAFTGASMDRAGAFELANGGTLLLDEVGELDVGAQASMLRVLETRQFRRVGGTREIEVSLLVVAATNAPLKLALDKGTFRRDLYHRLNLFPIHVPPLRERREDIVLLAEYFCAAFDGNRVQRTTALTSSAADLLVSCDWPGNVRELRNVVERACLRKRVAGERGPLDSRYLSHLSNDVGDPPRLASEGDERARLAKALEACRWNRRQAARELGMPYSTLRYKIKIHGLDG